MSGLGLRRVVGTLSGGGTKSGIAASRISADRLSPAHDTQTTIRLAARCQSFDANRGKKEDEGGKAYVPGGSESISTRVLGGLRPQAFLLNWM